LAVAVAAHQTVNPAITIPNDQTLASSRLCAFALKSSASVRLGKRKRVREVNLHLISFGSAATIALVDALRICRFVKNEPMGGFGFNHERHQIHEKAKGFAASNFPRLNRKVFAVVSKVRTDTCPGESCHHHPQ